jgi:hypothetical protein
MDIQMRYLNEKTKSAAGKLVFPQRFLFSMLIFYFV